MNYEERALNEQWEDVWLFDSFLYQVVTNDGVKWYRKVTDFINAHKAPGNVSTNLNPKQHLELQHQPILKGYAGPFYNGIQNDRTVIRYEQL